jgi:hypothetical protein
MTVVAPPMQPGPLRPNTDDMYDFLSWWFKDCNRGQIELGWLDPQTKILNRFRRFDLTEIEECAAFAADTNAQAGANMYFRASTISETAGTFTTDADFRQAPGPWADHDSSESIRRLETNGLSVKPCGWIVTGRTPHVRAQTFWPLTEPLTDPDMVRDLNARLSANFAGDPAVVNPTRLMRLAGSIAWPVKQGRTIAELTGFTLPQDDRPRRHVLHNIAFALPKPTMPTGPAAPAAPTGQAATSLLGLNTARGLIDRMKAGDNWHINMVRLVAHWIGRGWSNAEILTAAEALTLPGYTVAQTHAEVAKAIEGGRRKWGAPDPEHDISADDPSAPKPPALWIDASEWAEEAIPARPWLAPGYLMRGAVSALSGQGSGGKSSLVVRWTIALATGQAVGEFRPGKPSKVVNYNVEDDELEQRRRYSAALRASNQKPADVAGQVIRCGPESIGTLFERHPDTGRIVPTAAMDALEALCKETGADVLVCDPLAELHNAEENDNTAMRAVIAAFRGLAKRLNIAVLLLHHDRKGNNTPGDMDRLRGASAITGAVRVLLTLTSMSPEEAERFGIPPEERRRHFRIDGAKSNYAIAQEAEWWRLAGYPLANGEEVAACLPWSPPSIFDGLPMADCVAVLDALIARHPSGRPWGFDSRARDEWAGALLMAKGRTQKQAAAILNQWREAGTIIVGDGESSRRGHFRDAVIEVERDTVSEMRRQIRGGSSE